MAIPNVAGGAFNATSFADFLEGFAGGRKGGLGHFNSHYSAGYQRQQQQGLVAALHDLTKAISDLTSKIGGLGSSLGGGGVGSGRGPMFDSAGRPIISMQSKSPIGGDTPRPQPVRMMSAGKLIGGMAGVAIGGLAAWHDAQMNDLTTMDYATQQFSRQIGPGYYGSLIRNSMYKGFNGGLNAQDYAGGVAGITNTFGYQIGSSQFNNIQGQANQLRQWNPLMGNTNAVAGISGLYTNQNAFRLRMAGINPYVGGAGPFGRQTLNQVANQLVRRANGGQMVSAQKLQSELGDQGGPFQAYLSGFDQNTQQALISAMQNAAAGGIYTKSIVGKKQSVQNAKLKNLAATAPGEINATETSMDAFTKSLDAFTSFLQKSGLGNTLGGAKGWAGQILGPGLEGLGAGVGLSRLLFGGGLGGAAAGGGGSGGLLGLLGLGSLAGKTGIAGKLTMGTTAESAASAGGGSILSKLGLSKLGGIGGAAGSIAAVLPLVLQQLGDYSHGKFKSGVGVAFNDILKPLGNLIPGMSMNKAWHGIEGIFGGGTVGAGGSGPGAPATGGGGTGAQAVGVAEKFLGKPYVWGGSNPQKGFDCSGLTQYAYSQIGVQLPRTSQQQEHSGREVAKDQLAVGDLVFYGEPAYHVGMYVGGGKMIDAPHTGANIRIENLWGGESHFRRIVGQAGMLQTNPLSSNTNNSNNNASSGSVARGSWVGGTSEMSNIASGLASVLGIWSNQNGAANGISAGGINTGSSGPPSGMPSGNLASWEKSALKILGLNYNQYASGLTNIIQHESSGNPHAENLTDSNAKAGNPSKGVMQTTQTTFNSYAIAGHKNIWNPVDNIIAGVRYIESRYGLNMLAAGGNRNSAGNYIGYALGAQEVEKDEWAKVHKGELIFQRDTADALREWSRSANSKTKPSQMGSPVTLNFHPNSINISMTNGSDAEQKAAAKGIMNYICEDQRLQTIASGNA